MGKFNINDYEPVKARKKRFYQTYTDGRIIVELINPTTINERSIFKVTIYKDHDNHLKGLPLSTGYAHELRDTELKKTRSGSEYESVNYSSWVENCEESAVGRALDNGGFASNMKCSREEIEQANKNKETLKESTMPKKDQIEYIVDLFAKLNPNGLSKEQKDWVSDLDNKTVRELDNHISELQRVADQGSKE